MRPRFGSKPPSSDQEGAGNAGCPLHPWSACSKKARGRTTGSAGTTGIPCAMVLRLIRALPGDRALLPPSSADRSADLAPASGRQNHTTSPSATTSFVHDGPRPSHPAPNVRDDREAPLLSSAGQQQIATDRGWFGSGIFSQGRLDGANQLETAAQISVCVHAIFQPVSRLQQAATRRNGLICPTAGMRKLTQSPSCGRSRLAMCCLP